ncbi:FecR domain-containing protein [Chitinophaga solisilvae]|uniref:FecR domain-containing protein n=1 Tax=Chitinophaga solisilvae TaxID=1233460 RepID=UPI001369AA64|nr:FecR domain-containing protein [Chitinophaga solisilvae]
MQPDRLEELFQRYLDQTISPEELTALQAVMAGNYNREIIDRLLERAFSNGSYIAQGTDHAPEEVYREILERIQSASAKERRIIPRWYYAAAAILGILVAVAAWWQLRPVRESAIVPGGPHARLTLADGRVITLDTAREGTLVRMGNVRIIKSGNGALSYQLTAGSTIPAQENILTTPAGGEYRLVLPDGSKVWLNAASELRYPPAFHGNARSVQLRGEAYFEVTANEQQPFEVVSGDMRVQALGTAFNVNAYTDEKVMRATLLNGAVNISRQRGMQRLQPGQEAVCSMEQPGILIQEADTGAVIAWKNGSFVFDDMPLEAVARQLSRWYDVEVEMEDRIKQTLVSGVISRSSPLPKVLTILGMTGKLNYTVTGRKIIIKG